MLINDLNHFETVDKANKLEGGVSAFIIPSFGEAFGLSGTVYTERLRGTETYALSGPSGSAVGSKGMDFSKLTKGLTLVGLN